MSESNIRDQGRADRQPTLTAVVAVAGNLDAISRSIRMRQTRKAIMIKTHTCSEAICNCKVPTPTHNPNTQQCHAAVRGCVWVWVMIKSFESTGCMYIVLLYYIMNYY